MKTPGDLAATRWISSHDQMAMHLSVVTLMELRSRFQIMPTGRRRNTLDRWLFEEVPDRFGERILLIDEQTADICGRLFGDRGLAPTIRRAMDFWMAATALQHDLTIVTHDARRLAYGHHRFTFSHVRRCPRTCPRGKVLPCPA